MASPLLPVHNATLNSINTPRTAQSSQRYSSYDVCHVSSVTTTTSVATNNIAESAEREDTARMASSEASSSPFVSSVMATTTITQEEAHNHSSQENMAPAASNPIASAAPAAATAPPITASAVPPTMTIKPSRPTSRIMSGSELSPLKILQGRVTSPAGTGSPASPDSGAEGHREEPSASCTSPPVVGAGRRSISGVPNGQMLPPVLPLGRTPRKITSPDKRFPVRISVPPVMSSATAASGSRPPSSAGTRSPPQHGQLPLQVQVPPSPPQQAQSLFAQMNQQHRKMHGRQMSLDEAIQLNEGLKQAIDIFEDVTSVIENDDSVMGAENTSGTPNSGARSPYYSGGSGGGSRGGSGTVSPRHQPVPRRQHQRGASLADSVDGLTRPEDAAAAGAAGADDTMISTFSTFSAVPMFSKVGQTPRAGTSAGGSSNGDAQTPMRTPRANGHSTINGTGYGTSHGAGPVPNRSGYYESSGNTTNLLMDFTEQLRQAHSQQQPPTKGSSSNAPMATPQRKNLVNLLDFEIPPLPTPRSIPTITPRELESLKSNFLSEISSLKASLSGKEAEVLALKTAVGDAEKRVGSCMEQLREDQAMREQLAEEKEGWERRAREMDEVLQKVKAEIVLGRREREELEAKLEESVMRREAAEMMAQEAETKMAVMRAGRATAENESAGVSGGKTRSPSGGAASAASATQREVEMAVERVARDLHAAYKAKHETKVAALKKSYEARWEKRVKEVEGAAEALARENETLRRSRDATLARLVPGEDERAKEEARRQREARDAAQIKELGAEVDKLEAVVRTVKADNSELRTLLEQERVEKGELVILAEELMSMQQQSFIGGGGGNGPKGPAATPAPATAPAAAPAPTPATGRTPRPTTAGTTTSRPPRTPSATRTSNVAVAPSSAKRHSMVMGAGANGSTATTPGGRPMSMHGTGRVSGLKPPGASGPNGSHYPPVSRIGRPGHDRKQSAVGGIPRPGSGLGTRSGLMSSIEKMGSYRGRE